MTSAATVAGNQIAVQVLNDPGELYDFIDITDPSGNEVPNTRVFLAAGNTTLLLWMTTNYTPRTNIVNGVPLTAGGYTVRYVLNDTFPAYQTVPLNISAYMPPPFLSLDATNGILFYRIGLSSGAIPGTNGQWAAPVSGTIVVGGQWVGNNYTIGLPTNVTIQFTLNNGSVMSPSQGGYNIGSPVFASGGTPTISFNTTLVPDGTYMLGGYLVDCDNAHWAAYQLQVYPISIVIKNGSAFQNPTGSYTIPTIYFGNCIHNLSPPAIDFVQYSGLPQLNTAYPYPGSGGSIVFSPPVYSPSCPFNPGFSPPGNPTTLRTSGWLIDEGICQVPLAEYQASGQFYATQIGGIFAQAWFSKNLTAENIEDSYKPMVRTSFLDGARNQNMLSPITTLVPMSTGTGAPFSQHWSAIQLDGRLAAVGLDGSVTTIAGPKRDTSVLPLDWTDNTLPEFPNDVFVGTIDTDKTYIFSDFGGGPNDCCWDPRNPNICYISQTLDGCIICCDFRSGTIGSVTYGPSNPRIYRYAGYKGGLNGTGGGGFQNGPALATVTSSFTGSIAGTTLTVTGLTGTISVGQYVGDGGEGNIAQGTTIVSGSGSGPFQVSGAAQTVATETMYTNNGDGALFNAVYSICMQKRTDVSGHPQAEMYVADNYNGLIRAIAPVAIPAFPGRVTGGAVTTLAGQQVGVDQVAITVTYTVSMYTITANGDGTASVVISDTPGPVAPTIVNGVGSVIRFLDTTTSEGWLNGGSDIDAASGYYIVTAFTDTKHFSVRVNPLPNPATVQIVISSCDYYSSPVPVTVGNSNCWTAAPQMIRMTSAGDIVIGEAFFNMMCRRLFLSGASNGQIHRIGAFGATHQPSGTGYGFLDVDDGVVTNNGAVTINTLGACGPLDDIVVAKEDSNPGSAATIWRWSLDGSYNGQFFGDGRGGTRQNFPMIGTGGGGHYPWNFAFSKTQSRCASFGASDNGIFSWRLRLSSDPADGTVVDGNLGDLAPSVWQYGPTGFPNKMKAPFPALYGLTGSHWWGANVLPQIDDFWTLYPNDFNPTGSNGAGQAGTLAGFIQSGMGGTFPRPEYAVVDDGLTPYVMGRDLAALIYYVRRQSLKGSFPTLYAAPLTYSLDCTVPQITITSGYPLRTSNTAIQVQWTTDKKTIGLIAAGTPHSQVSGSGSYPFNFWSQLESSYNTSHNVTISNLPDVTVSGNSPTYIQLIVKDKAGNWATTVQMAVS